MRYCLSVVTFSVTYLVFKQTLLLKVGLSVNATERWLPHFTMPVKLTSILTRQTALTESKPKPLAATGIRITMHLTT